MTEGNCLIRGGSIIDGTGADAYEADVRVTNGRIAEIGSNLSMQGEHELDASGCVVTPGFIDSHTHYDASLFWDPRCDPMALHGYTTILIGNCGLGMAPVRSSETEALGALFAYIEDLPQEVFKTQVPWSWESFDDYTGEMRNREWGVNIASCVSHSLLRQYVIGPEAWDRNSTEEEATKIADLANQAMKAGAIGVSTSLFDRSPDGRPVPSWHTSDDEMEKIFATVARYKGIIQTIPTQDDPDKWDNDLRWMGRFSAKYGIPVLSNHIGQRPDDPNNAIRLLDLAREIKATGGDVRHMISPRSLDIVMNFIQTMVFIYVPAWNEVLQGSLSREKKKAMLADPQWRSRARQDFDNSSLPGAMLENYQFIEVGKPELEHWVGRKFGELRKERGGHPSDVLADWGLETDLNAELLYPLTNTDPKIVGQLLDAPENLISNSDAGAHIGMFDGAGDSTFVLTQYVRDRADMTLPRAVYRLTKEQADFLGLKNRGIIAKGAIADLLVFNLDELEYGQATKVNDVPGGARRFRRPAGRYRFTLIDGVVAQCNGESTEALPARFLGTEDRVKAL